MKKINVILLCLLSVNVYAIDVDVDVDTQQYKPDIIRVVYDKPHTYVDLGRLITEYQKRLLAKCAQLPKEERNINICHFLKIQ
jgi:hypothetical protein